MQVTTNDTLSFLCLMVFCSAICLGICEALLISVLINLCLHFSYDKLQHNCDVKIMIYYFLNIVVTSKLRAWKRCFNRGGWAYSYRFSKVCDMKDCTL